MKRQYGVGLLTCALILLAARTCAQPGIEVVGGPKLSLDTLFRGDVVERTVTLKSTGDQALLIQSVKASCGCTGTVISRDSIPPGGSGTIRITFDSKNFVGQIHKKVTVFSNAQNSRTTVIEFTATVVQEIVLEPVQFWFKDADVGNTNTAVITLRNEGVERLTLKGYTTRLDGFTLRFPSQPLEHGEEVQLVAEYTPQEEASVIAESLFLQTSNPRQPELYIPIFGNAREFRFDETGP